MQILKDCLFVGLGGFTGAILRYLITLIPLKTQFPLTTFFVNISGAVIIGFIIGAAGALPNMNPQLILFLKTGLCGGYTTFSTMSVEIVDLFRNNHSIISVVYIITTVVFCILGVIFGGFLASLVFRKV
ncbi:MAG: fluoride efflux transporter CrcB [Ruminococcus sp.]|nr:fluoride efflux transporter CrcB [Ruminococcus sp.]